MHKLKFEFDGNCYRKELAVSDGFLPTSLKRPSRQLSDMLIHPREKPFGENSVVQSIEITYPDRKSFTSGTNNWVIYWFVVSMIAAFAAKPILKVNL